MFNPEKSGYVYYYTKGLSMWPTFISNDILRTKMIVASKLEPGDIVVLPEKHGKQVIHRLISINAVSKSVLILSTAGDRSGKDEPIHIDTDKELFKVINVLRKGAWKTPGRKHSLCCFRFPNLFVRMHCRIVRKFFW